MAASTLPCPGLSEDMKVVGLVGAARCNSHFYRLILAPLFRPPGLFTAAGIGGRTARRQARAAT
jgi:hypothetical protein